MLGSGGGGGPAIAEFAFLRQLRFRACGLICGAAPEIPVSIGRIHKNFRHFLKFIACVFLETLLKYKYKLRMIAVTECRAHGLAPIIPFLIGVSNRSGLRHLFFLKSTKKIFRRFFV